MRCGLTSEVSVFWCRGAAHAALQPQRHRRPLARPRVTHPRPGQLRGLLPLLIPSHELCFYDMIVRMPHGTAPSFVVCIVFAV